MSSVLQKNEIGVINGQKTLIKSDYTWEINNFNTISDCEAGKMFESPIFCVESNISKYEFRLEIKPNFEGQFICLYLKSLNKFAVDLDCSLCIEDDMYKFEKADKHLFSSNRLSWGYSKFLNKNLNIYKASSILSSNRLKILCKIGINTTTACNKNMSDVKLIIQDYEFYAHKNILTANSEIFAAMFSHDMIEKNENLVKIDDIDYQTFSYIMEFMYHGDIHEQFYNSTTLIVAANKYAMYELKQKCENALCNNISVDNVFEYLHLADLHAFDKLKNKTIDFIVLNGKQILENPAFDVIETLPKSLLINLLQAFILSQEECNSLKRKRKITPFSL